MTTHYHVRLQSRARGFFLITQEILDHVGILPDQGVMNVFIRHTSAGLSINENADPSVRKDFESFFNKIVPEGQPFITHDIEGPDDMPAHIKAALVGSSLSIPIENNRLLLGTWQGIYLCEFRDRPHRREIIVTIQT
jgi:secondary thiamine-phosphate synthase enzyme